jgi:hypothetical protein
MNRRGFLSACLATATAPYVVRAGVLMPVRSLWTPKDLSEASLEQLIREIRAMTVDQGKAIAITPCWIRPFVPLLGNETIERIVADVMNRAFA